MNCKTATRFVCQLPEKNAVVWLASAFGKCCRLCICLPCSWLLRECSAYHMPRKSVVGYVNHTPLSEPQLPLPLISCMQAPPMSILTQKSRALCNPRVERQSRSLSCILVVKPKSVTACGQVNIPPAHGASAVQFELLGPLVNVLLPMLRRRDPSRHMQATSALTVCLTGRALL